jgi:hypothetical protein
MINKVATTHCSFLRRQIKREGISTNALSVTKTELCTILRDVCIVSRDVCIVSNRLTCIDVKLSEMEILAQPLSLPFIIENLTLAKASIELCNSDLFSLFRNFLTSKLENWRFVNQILLLSSQIIFRMLKIGMLFG